MERIEFEYVRHGTQCLIANFEVATGEVIEPSVGPTRTEADFAQPLERTVQTDPEASFIFIVDQLDTHRSESLVRWVAARCGLDLDLGVKGKAGILKDRHSRMAFLQDESHRIRLVYTPRHASWLNQVEIWFSVLVRRWLKRGSFERVVALRERLLEFTRYFNQTLAKPCRWTYAGRPLHV